MINSIFVISALIFVATIPPLLFGIVQNSDALKNRNHWKKVKIVFFKSRPQESENSERFLAWLIVKTSQKSFLSQLFLHPRENLNVGINRGDKQYSEVKSCKATSL